MFIDQTESGSPSKEVAIYTRERRRGGGGRENMHYARVFSCAHIYCMWGTHWKCSIFSEGRPSVGSDVCHHRPWHNVWHTGIKSVSLSGVEVVSNIQIVNFVSKIECIGKLTRSKLEKKIDIIFRN